MTSLPLPRFTFLCGALGSGQVDLARALAAQDEALCAYDFEEPLRMMVHEVFLGGYDLAVDLTGTARYNRLAPWSDERVVDFLSSVERFLRGHLSRGVLGHLALAEYERNALVPGAFERLLFRDAINPHDIAVFANKFPKECLCLHIGDLTRSVEPLWSPGAVQHIWLPEPSLDARIHRLRHELEPVR